jgi:tetratricopeptide (TPR) repeat protein
MANGNRRFAISDNDYQLPIFRKEAIMAKTILTVLLIVLLNVLVGCYGPDSGRSQLIPSRMKAVTAIDASESDIIEQVVINRQAYQRYIAVLIAHYESTGNNMKLGWAKDELKGLKQVPQYNYIIEAIIAGPNLKAGRSIAEAELIYMEALRLEKQAKKYVVLTNEEMLRLALDKYNQLIKKYPTSDRIDDAAFKAGGIYEYFKDYTIALLYYQRAYQWDPDTIHPARFKAAYILDKRLHRRAEALELYQQVVEKEGRHKKWKEYAEKRIRKLTKSGEVVE